MCAAHSRDTHILPRPPPGLARSQIVIKTVVLLVVEYGSTA